MRGQRVRKLEPQRARDAAAPPKTTPTASFPPCGLEPSACLPYDSRRQGERPRKLESASSGTWAPAFAGATPCQLLFLWPARSPRNVLKMANFHPSVGSCGRLFGPGLRRGLNHSGVWESEEKTQNRTTEASMLLKTQEVRFHWVPKRSQNEFDLACPAPPSSPVCGSSAIAPTPTDGQTGGVRNIRKWLSRSRESADTREKHKIGETKLRSH